MSGWARPRPAARVSGNRTCWRCWTTWSYSTEEELWLVNVAAAEHARAHHAEDQNR